MLTPQPMVDGLSSSGVVVACINVSRTPDASCQVRRARHRLRGHRSASTPLAPPALRWSSVLLSSCSDGSAAPHAIRMAQHVEAAPPGDRGRAGAGPTEEMMQPLSSLPVCHLFDCKPCSHGQRSHLVGNVDVDLDVGRASLRGSAMKGISLWQNGSGSARKGISLWQNGSGSARKGSVFLSHTWHGRVPPQAAAFLLALGSPRDRRCVGALAGQSSCDRVVLCVALLAGTLSASTR